jgi:hypothetical protein
MGRHRADDPSKGDALTHAGTDAVPKSWLADINKSAARSTWIPLPN